MNGISQDLLWEVLLNLRKELKKIPADISLLSIIIRNKNPEILINQQTNIKGQAIHISYLHPIDAKAGQVVFTFDDQYGFALTHNDLLDSDQVSQMFRFLPLCFAAQKAYQLKRCYSILHFAQTLDGRIATYSGNSKWIGNHDDLIHAHRMRALCDAVLIGTNTLRSDAPALTVRLVKGPNPIKVVVGNSSCCFDSLVSNDGKVLFFTSHMDEHEGDIEKVYLNGFSKHISPALILKELYKRGIYSIYIEGGAITASSFLQNQSLDLIQLFLAPKIFGSGVSSFSLPSISSIDQAVIFTKSTFNPMGDGVLFEGQLTYTNPG